jgi:hypothetical protein
MPFTAVIFNWLVIVWLIVVKVLIPSVSSHITTLKNSEILMKNVNVKFTQLFA